MTDGQKQIYRKKHEKLQYMEHNLDDQEIINRWL